MNRLSLFRLIAFTAVASLGIVATQAFAQPTAARAKQPVAPPAGAFATIYPSQSKVAAHTSFSTISASSAAVGRALPAVNTPAAAKVNGKRDTIQGTVIKVIAGLDSVTLSFALNFHSQVSARVSRQNYSHFPDLNTLVGKRVLVTGTVAHPTKWPQIEVTKAGQIQIIQ